MNEGFLAWLLANVLDGYLHFSMIKPQIGVSFVLVYTITSLMGPLWRAPTKHEAGALSQSCAPCQ
jgi:hypothetical protein